MIKTKILQAILKDIKNVFHIRDKKKFVLLNLPYLFFFYIVNIFSRQVNSYTGGDFIDRSIIALSDISNMSYLPSFRANDILAGAIFSAVIWFAVYKKRKMLKSLDKGENMVQPDGGVVKILSLM